MALSCYHCDYSSDLKFNLRRHIEARHLVNKPSKEKSYPCFLCHLRLPSRLKAIEHYCADHDIALDVEHLSFESLSAFESWKTDIEESERVRFVRSRGDLRNRRGTRINRDYFCFRDGIPRLKHERKRNLKSLGSNKINACCPSQISLVIDIVRGSVAVSYTKTHVGHSNELRRIPLSKTERESIAERLSADATFADVLTTVREDRGDLDRVRLLNRQDLANITRDYKLNKSNPSNTSRKMGPSLGPVSFEEFIYRLKESSTAVRFFKPSGLTSSEFLSLQSLDTVLVLASDLQISKLREVGRDCISFDRISAPNSLSLEMTSLVVSDRHGNAFPCAVMFSNRCDVEVFKVFIQTLANCIGGVMQSDYFFGDVNDNIYNVWCDIMVTPGRRIFSSWHVDTAWKKLTGRIDNASKKLDVYSSLRKLLLHPEESSFYGFFQNTLLNFISSQVTVEFGRQFCASYSKNFKSWAYCFRKDFGSDIHLGIVHRKLNNIFSTRAQQLDRAINAVLKFAGENDTNGQKADRKKLVQLRRAHEDAISLLRSGSSLTIDRTAIGWTMTVKNSTDVYDVVACDASCDCELRCDDCDVCIHNFKCTCPHFSLKCNLCVHIHLIVQARNSLLNVEEAVIVDRIPLNGRNTSRGLDGLTSSEFISSEEDDFQKELDDLNFLYDEVKKQLITKSDVGIARKALLSVISDLSRNGEIRGNYFDKLVC